MILNLEDPCDLVRLSYILGRARFHLFLNRINASRTRKNLPRLALRFKNTEEECDKCKSTVFYIHRGVTRCVVCDKKLVENI